MSAWVTSPVEPARARDPWSLFGLQGPPEPEIQRYRRLTTRWLEETRHHAWLEDVVTSPSALAIGRLPSAARLLARDLERQEEGSFARMALLRVVLRDGPEVSAAATGRRDDVRAIWLAWLRARLLL